MSDRSLVAIGESLVDLIEERADDDRVYRPRYGGSPLNVAVGAARLGATVRFVTALGADAFGRQIMAFLQRENVTVIDDANPVRQTCLAVATATDDGVSYEYFGDPNSMVDIHQVSTDLVQHATVIHAGSTAFLTDPVRHAITEAFAAATAFKTMDPNPRPSLIHDLADYRSGLDRIIDRADLVKLSAEDIDFLYPGRAANDVASSLIDRGVSVVVVTAASKPLLVVSGHASDWLMVPSVESVDPTGAGDSFMASLLADIVTEGIPNDHQAWVRLAGRAAVAASFTCRSVGGASSMPTSRDLIGLQQLPTTGRTPVPRDRATGLY